MSSRITGLTLALLLAGSSLHAAPAALAFPPDLPEILARFVAAEHWRVQSQDSSGELRQVLFEAATAEKAALPAVTRAVARRLGLPPAATVGVIEAELCSWQAAQRGWTKSTGTRDEGARDEKSAWLARGEDALARAQGLAPAAARIELEQAAFFDSWRSWDESYLEKLLGLIARSPAPARLIAALEEATGFESRTAVMSLYVARIGPHPVLLAELAKGLRFAPARTPALAAALAGLARFPAESTTGLETYLLAERLADLLGLGLVDQALGELESASPEARSQVLTAGAGTIETEVGGIAFRGTRSDVRLELAAAQALDGQSRAAGVLLASLPALPAKGDRAEQAQERERNLLAGWLSPTADGPGEMLAGIAAAEGTEDGLTSSLWRTFAAQLAVDSGFPALARQLFTADVEERRSHAAVLTELREAQPGLPVEVAERADSLAELLERSRLDLQQAIDALPAADSVGSTSP